MLLDRRKNVTVIRHVVFICGRCYAKIIKSIIVIIVWIFFAAAWKQYTFNYNVNCNPKQRFYDIIMLSPNPGLLLLNKFLINSSFTFHLTYVNSRLTQSTIPHCAFLLIKGLLWLTQFNGDGQPQKNKMCRKVHNIHNGSVLNQGFYHVVFSIKQYSMKNSCWNQKFRSTL